MLFCSYSSICRERKTYLNNCIIFILANTIVRMEMDVGGSECMVLQIVMDHTDNRVPPLTRINGFINQVVHLEGNGLTTHTENPTFAGSQEIQWPNLLRT